MVELNNGYLKDREVFSYIKKAKVNPYKRLLLNWLFKTTGNLFLVFYVGWLLLSSSVSVNALTIFAYLMLIAVNIFSFAVTYFRFRKAFLLEYFLHYMCLNRINENSIMTSVFCAKFVQIMQLSNKEAVVQLKEFFTIYGNTN